MERMEITTVGALRKWLKNAPKVYVTFTYNEQGNSETVQVIKSDLATTFKPVDADKSVIASVDSDLNIYINQQL